MRGLLLNYQFGMWDAVLKKIKTNTRRGGGLDKINLTPDDYEFIGVYSPSGLKMYAKMQHRTTGKIEHVIVRFRPNDYAYLQEPILKSDKDVFYKYTDINGHSEAEAFAPLIDAAIKNGASWKNKYYMAGEDARYYVKFSTWKIQRLNDISEADCLAEGVQKQDDSYYYSKDGVKVLFPTAKKAYFSLYNSVNNIKENNNPWLFSYYFELCQKPE